MSILSLSSGVAARLGLWLAVLVWGGVLAWWPRPAAAQIAPPVGESPANFANADAATVPPFVAGRVIVGMRGDVGAAVGAAAALPWADLSATVLSPLDLRASPVQSAQDSPRGYLLAVPPGREWEVIETLQANPAVLFAEPDWLARTAQLPAQAALETPFSVSDPLYTDQWYLARIGSNRAWAAALAEGAAANPIIVAVVDTGVDLDHPEFAGRLLMGRNYVTVGGSPMDDNGHGSHIAGAIAAANNTGGMAGVGWNVRIMPMKVLNAFGVGSFEAVAQAIRDAADGGAQIINLSIQSSFSSSVLHSAIQYAAASGALLIAAAGNNGINVQYPAAYPEVMAVGATTYFDTRAYYSGVGPHLDLVAPGGSAGNSILSAWASLAVGRCANGLREVNGAFYCLSDGTSMATAVVSGAAALVWATQPSLTATEVWAILEETAQPLSAPATDVGAGRLDVARAARAALTPRLVVSHADVVAATVEGDAPVARRVALTNPSLAPYAWQIVPADATNWVGVRGVTSGTVTYATPVMVDVVFTPTAVSTGTHLSALQVFGGPSLLLQQAVGVSLQVAPKMPNRLFFALFPNATTEFGWVNAEGAAVINHAITPDAALALALPFTMTVGGRSYTEARLYADGMVALPGTSAPANLPPRCLNNMVWPAVTIAGWWSDLDTGLQGSRLLTFQPDANRWVIQYDHVPVAGSDDPAQRLTMQIVLYRSGQVDVHYRDVPTVPPAALTVGMAAQDGRRYNQVVCLSPATRVVTLPQPRQTLRFRWADLY